MKSQIENNENKIRINEENRGIQKIKEYTSFKNKESSVIKF